MAVEPPRETVETAGQNWISACRPPNYSAQAEEALERLLYGIGRRRKLDIE